MSSSGKAAVAIAATAVVASLLFLGSSGTTGAGTMGAGTTLGSVLDRTASAGALQLKAVRDGAEADVWVRGPGEVRWQESPSRYRIASGSRLLDESKFVVAGSLSNDGRIGKIVDAQGIVALRPPLARRWTPVTGPLLVKPGDWLRCDVRGANAASIALASRFEATAGPGTLVWVLYQKE
ncbi:MAG: hypothetical protein WED34_19505 [Planctomycetales bacterium]